MLISQNYFGFRHLVKMCLSMLFNCMQILNIGTLPREKVGVQDEEDYLHCKHFLIKRYLIDILTLILCTTNQNFRMSVYLPKYK